MSQCMAKSCMCVTHGMPCVTMHGLYEGYIYGCQIQFGGRGSSFSPWEQQQGGGGREKEKEEEGKRRRRRKGEEKERKGKEEGRKGEEKGKKKREEERGGRRKKKEEEEGVLCSEQTRTAKNPELRYKR